MTNGSMAGVFTGKDLGYPPCTPQACMEILDHYGIDCTGKKAVVVGRSLVVGLSLIHIYIKIKITNIDIPVAFASAFEGEIIRRGDMQVEFDGSRVDCCELVMTKDASEIEDHKITLIGPDIDEMPVGSKQSICYVCLLYTSSAICLPSLNRQAAENLQMTE